MCLLSKICFTYPDWHWYKWFSFTTEIDMMDNNCKHNGQAAYAHKRHKICNCNMHNRHKHNLLCTVYTYFVKNHNYQHLANRCLCTIRIITIYIYVERTNVLCYFKTIKHTKIQIKWQLKILRLQVLKGHLLTDDWNGCRRRRKLVSDDYLIYGHR